MGVAMPVSFASRFPSLCPRLWRELDIVPIILEDGVRPGDLYMAAEAPHKWEARGLDEQSDSMGRKCVRFGCMSAPALS